MASVGVAVGSQKQSWGLLSVGPRRDLAVGTREKAAREVRERKSLIHSQIIRGGGPTERFGGGPTARPGKPFPDAFSDPTATAAKATRSWRWDSFRELFFVPTATGAKATRSWRWDAIRSGGGVPKNMAVGSQKKWQWEPKKKAVVRQF